MRSISLHVLALSVRGDQEDVAIAAKDLKWNRRIVTEVVDGVLKIYLFKDAWGMNSADKKLKAYVSFTTLDRLSASGACDVWVEGVLVADTLAIIFRATDLGGGPCV